MRPLQFVWLGLSRSLLWLPHTSNSILLYATTWAFFSTAQMDRFRVAEGQLAVQRPHAEDVGYSLPNSGRNARLVHSLPNICEHASSDSRDWRSGSMSGKLTWIRAANQRLTGSSRPHGPVSSTKQ